MCVLSDHQPANHQELELSVTKEETVNTRKSEEHSGCSPLAQNLWVRADSQHSNKVMFVGQHEHCAQPITTEFDGARTQRSSPDSNTVMFDKENERCAQPTSSEFDDARTHRRPAQN